MLMIESTVQTCDKHIRTALKHNLKVDHKGESHVKIIEELGLTRSSSC